VHRSGLIAVNYAARAYGVKKQSNIHDALELCPNLKCVHVEVLGTSTSPTVNCKREYMID
jgi:nucleotidyltransferase/DNA polymerase involved in DNA repair